MQLLIGRRGDLSTLALGYDFDTQPIEIPKKWLVTISQGRLASTTRAFPENCLDILQAQVHAFKKGIPSR
jgi:hypothetical protein